MDKTFTGILQKLVTEQGKEALLNPSKCKAFLADYTSGEYKKESRLLLQALDAAVIKAIDGAQDMALCKKQQVKVLEDECFLKPEIAADLVDTLALVLKGEEKEKNLCKACGKELPGDWKACPYCGAAVVEAARPQAPERETAPQAAVEPVVEAAFPQQIPPQTPTSPQPIPATPKKRLKRKALIIIAVVLVLTLLYIYFYNAEPLATHRFIQRIFP